MNPVSNKRTITFLCAVLLLVVPVAAQDKPDKKLEQAIAVLRRVDQGKLNDQQKKAKAEEIDAAWGVIQAAGKMGVARLKEEIKLVDQNKEQDDYFKLNASALLWNIGQFDEVEAALCARLTEETLYEIRRLNRVMERLGRSRYRKVIGLTEKVE